MEKTQSADGTTIAFDRYGDGPPLVFLMGAVAHRAISPGIAELAAHAGATVLAYDRRGRGDSGDTPPYAVAREIEDLAAVIDAAGGEAAVFGHSSGAVLALDAAAAGLPISRLALYEAPVVVDGNVPPGPTDYLARLDAAGGPEQRLEMFFTEAIGMPPGQVAGMKAAPVWPSLVSVGDTVAYDGRIMDGLGDGAPLPRARWADVTVPTLVLAGGASPGLHSGARAIAEALPDARLAVLDGQAHNPAWDVLGRTLRAFLADVDAAPV